jgi:hypothetical protein
MQTFSIKGQIIDAKSRQPLVGLRIEAWDKDLVIDDLLGSAVSDQTGRFAIEFDRRYYQELIVDRRPDIYFKVYYQYQLVADTSDHVLWNAGRAVPEIVIAISGDATGGLGSGGGGRGADGGGNGAFEVRGRVTDDRRVPARGLKVEALDHDLDGTTSLGSTTTDDAGAYSIRYTPARKPRADLEVRALSVGSKVIYGAGPLETVNLVIPTTEVPRATEYEQLLTVLQPQLGRTALGQLTPAGVNYLANKTGWDPRSVAMAAQAEQLASTTHIPAAHYYALFRSGAPSDAVGMSRLSTGFVTHALTSAIESKVIAATGSIEDTVAAHQAESARHLTALKPVGAVSSLGEMLDLRLDAATKSTFIAQYQVHSTDPAALWKALADARVAPGTIAALQTDGKLGYLTRFNAPLVARLRERAGIAAADDLARAGLYRPSAWIELIGNDVPAGLTREAYAAGLAAQVNLSYPTLVTAAMVGTGEVVLPAARAGRNADAADAVAGPSSEVANFLVASHPDHEIGVSPVKTWRGYGQLSPAAQAGARGVERMYQISPSNESMIALSRAGLHSAYQVVSDPPQTFLARYGGGFPSEQEAKLVYTKAQEVHSTTLNLAVTFLAQRASPNVYGTTGDVEKQPPAPQENVPGGPTLEELFDNLDYCACDHCKSVLSPAAYLVELLQFIDLAPEVLQGGQNPIEALRARRPDIEHLLLSCENTNIALPYVDLVNEALEFYVVAPSFAAFRQHDLGTDAISADLLADPQFVEDTAYDATKAEVFPWTLPFDMPLAAMRLILQTCDTTLSAALRLLGDAAGARRERLGLGAGEHSILTSTAFRALPVYFGLPAATTIDSLNDQVADGKTFSRLTEVSYEELVAILRTRFINPGVTLVPALERLQLSMATLDSWYAGTISNADLLALLPPDLDPADYGGDVLAWLTANRDLIMTLIVLTDTSDPAAPEECNFATLELRFASPDPVKTRLTALAYHKLLRFVRLWKKLGWSIELTDQVVTAFLPTPSKDLTDGTIDAAFQSLLARIANFLLLLDALSVSAAKIPDWLAVWDAAAAAGVRRERLAGLLRIGVTDLDDLSTITGLDPLADDLQDDAPALLRLVDRWRELKAIGAKVTDLDYLLRHADASGKLTPSDDALLRGLKSLRDGLTAVDGDLNVAPGNADLAFAKAKMALVYDATVVNWLFALAGDTTSYRASLLTAEEVLPTKLTAVDPRLSYDPFAKQVGFTGILPAAVHTALDTAADSLLPADVEFPGALSTLIADVKTAVATLAADGAQDLQDLNVEYPELKLAYDAMRAAATPADATKALLDAIFPSLRGQLKQISVRGGLAAVIQAEPVMVDALTSGPAVVHADGDAGRGALSDFERLETEVALDASGTFRFYLDPPASDDYLLYVAAPLGTTVTLAVGGAPAIPATAVGASGEVQTAVVVKLSAGALVLAELTLAALPSGRATLRWRTKGMAKTDVPASRIYDQTRTLAARASLLRLQKAATLARLLALTPRELAYFAGENAETTGVLDALAVDPSISASDLHTQWGRVALLVWFAALKRENEPEQDTWVGILENPGIVNVHGDLLILGVSGWKAADLTQVLTRFALAQGDLARLSNLRKVKGVLDWVTAADYPAADLLTWCKAAPLAADLAAAKMTIRAKLQDAPWRETMKSVNDALRNQRRDALVSYIIHHKPPTSAIDTADKLYEHFLIDVQMDACMQTSRIRQALSTVQLFITRCFMNLEPGVVPAALRADRWEYMKRYRVWEANRKIFLYPENWLEPELRDSKSTFFRELEGELMKADITDELAENAFLAYLQKLDHVARLEIAGATVEERTPGDPTDDVLHVLGRTHGATREYYYRRYEGGYWLPWDKVSLNIQGDHVLPVVWKGRLFVFWLNILEKAEPVGDKSPEDMRTQSWKLNARKTAEVSLAWGEYYQGKWTSPKSTHTGDPLAITGLVEFEPRKLVLAARTEKPDPKVSERLILDVLYFQNDHGHSFKVTFTSKNAPPLVGGFGFLEIFFTVEAFNYVLFWKAAPGGQLDAGSLSVADNPLKVNITQPEHASSKEIVETLLTPTGRVFAGHHIRPILKYTENPWETPFFYHDQHSTFFVKPDEKVIMVDEYIWYYVELAPPVVVYIPPIYEVPIPDPIGPVINPPLSGLGGGINPAAQFVLPVDNQFAYGGAKFDARGIVKEAP